ncbi:hypothetical protein [Rufibacter immobilis]|uniref:hypothetical protein n=1 Tax=Rufibacter immobilis TaxID=1348778 RepID=UPI0035EC5F80
MRKRHSLPNSLAASPRKLKKTQLHFLWLSQFDVPYHYNTAANGQTFLVVRTIDDREFTINLDYGTFAKKTKSL